MTWADDAVDGSLAKRPAAARGVSRAAGKTQAWRAPAAIGGAV